MHRYFYDVFYKTLTSFLVFFLNIILLLCLFLAKMRITIALKFFALRFGFSIENMWLEYFKKCFKMKLKIFLFGPSK